MREAQHSVRDAGGRSAGVVAFRDPNTRRMKSHTAGLLN
jgi:hypothetical protein